MVLLVKVSTENAFHFLGLQAQKCLPVHLEEAVQKIRTFLTEKKKHSLFVQVKEEARKGNSVADEWVCGRQLPHLIWFQLPTEVKPHRTKTEKK